jgi:CDP-2,3-bis-(O-geranylgeranyl)-sn-glycerol synthase
MHFLAIVQGLVLVLVANGAPIVAKRLFGVWGEGPVDFGARLADGGLVFGPSKTIRGLIASLVATALAASLLGLGWKIGALAAAAAMAGDLLSSFVKRRLNMPPQGMAPGIDQAPESFFPLVALMQPLGLTLVDVLAATMLFWISNLVLSRALFNLKIRERPY